MNNVAELHKLNVNSEDKNVQCGGAAQIGHKFTGLKLQ